MTETALRESLPQANPAIYMTLALGITAVCRP